MQSIHRSARVPYSVDDMLALVNDIEAYPNFLHWCQAARIDKVAGDVVEAALDIGIRGIHRTMRTRNSTTSAGEHSAARILIEMIDGPLRHLSGGWVFNATDDGGCDVELSLNYDVHKTPFGFLLRALFDEIANSQLNAFTRRADVVYAKR